jgi:hypothetical protein
MSGFVDSLKGSTLNWTLYNILHVPLQILVQVRKVGKYNQILQAFCRNHHQGKVLPEVKLISGTPGLTENVLLDSVKTVLTLEMVRNGV